MLTPIIAHRSEENRSTAFFPTAVTLGGLTARRFVRVGCRR